MRTALDYVDELVAGPGPSAIVAVGPEKLIRARQNSLLLNQIRSSALLIADGIGVVWAARFLGLASIERVTGADLMEAICGRAAERGYKIFLYGAPPETNSLACAALEKRFPGIAIVGRRDGYVAQEKMPELISEINASGAQILFVALGSPRQELWMASHLSKLKVKVCQGVGGTFAVLAGTVPRAPAIWQAMNLEWAYRLVTDWSRFSRSATLPPFVWGVLLARFSRHRR
jgi:N-acetylglucosaminyldiphosphoundecaprenol N-acetyl-beta-D-mannosaminyltransferase